MDKINKPKTRNTNKDTRDITADPNDTELAKELTDHANTQARSQRK